MFNPELYPDEFNIRRTYPALTAALRALEHFSNYAARDAHVPVQRAWLGICVAILEHIGMLDEARSLRRAIAALPDLRQLPPLRSPSLRRRVGDRTVTEAPADQ